MKDVRKAATVDDPVLRSAFDEGRGVPPPEEEESWVIVQVHYAEKNNQTDAVRLEDLPDFIQRLTGELREGTAWIVIVPRDRSVCGGYDDDDQPIALEAPDASRRTGTDRRGHRP